jgi:hypothetical protein
MPLTGRQLIAHVKGEEQHMKTTMLSLWRAALALALITTATQTQAADPRIDSWLTRYSGKYARVFTNDAAKNAGNAVTTWGNGTQNQTAPAYSGVQEIYLSASWVYIRSSGLGIHTMGPWYLNAAHTQIFPNFPKNQKTFYRIPRVPVVPATRTLTGLGAIGYFVDGVAMFDSRDGFVWTGAAEAGNGTGYWNREAWVNEGVTLDPGYAHQENSGTHHYHANPIALRYLLGDHVDYNAATKTYSESVAPVTKHSPILGWVRDGFPIYGPYGYASASNSASGVRRMVSGYQLRNGTRGTDNLTTAGRASIPQWAVRLYNVSSNQSGPAVSTTYPLGRYMEDNAYLDDLGYTQGVDFDLDENNGRWCVTPEFPGGTYAYFVAINADGSPAFPYNIGRAFYGTPTGAGVTTLAETVTTNFVGAVNSGPQLSAPALNPVNNTVTLTWSSVEGGTYRVESSTALPTWTTNIAGVVSEGITTAVTNAGESLQFFRVARTALATYDPVTGATTGTGGGILSVLPTSGARGTTFTITINIDPAAQPAPPPQNAPVNSVTVGSITGANNVHVSQTQVTSSITIPAGAATGAQTVTVVFPGPPGNPTATVTYTLANGFTIN